MDRAGKWLQLQLLLNGESVTLACSSEPIEAGARTSGGLSFHRPREHDFEPRDYTRIGGGASDHPDVVT